MNKGQFLDWYFSEYKKAANVIVSDKGEIESWYDRCIESHDGMADLVAKVELEPEVKKLSSGNGITLTFALCNEIPEYFSLYGFSHADLLKPEMPEKSKWPKWKWSKHIAGWLERSHADQSVRTKVGQLLSKLGQEWALLKVNKDTYYLRLTNDPVAFVKLGSYGFDANSCFRKQSVNEVHKFIIGTQKNSFVGFIYRGENFDITKIAKTGDILSDGVELYCRFWGVQEENAFHVCNVYPREIKAGGNVKKTFEEGFKRFLNDDKICKTDSAFDVFGIYHNPDLTSTYHTKDYNIDTAIVFDFEDKYLNKYRKCITCGQQMSPTNVIVAGERGHYCVHCATSKYKFQCEFSRTWCNSLHQVVNKDNKTIKVYERIRDRYFRKSEHNSLFYHLDLLSSIGKNEFILSSLVNDNEYHHCQYCSEVNESARTKCWKCKRNVKEPQYV